MKCYGNVRCTFRTLRIVLTYIVTFQNDAQIILNNVQCTLLTFSFLTSRKYTVYTASSRVFVVFLFSLTNNGRFSKLATIVVPAKRRAKIYVHLRVVTKTVGGWRVTPLGLLRDGKRNMGKTQPREYPNTRLVIKTNCSTTRVEYNKTFITIHSQ